MKIRNNVNWTNCKQSFLCNVTNDHVWRLKFSRVLCPRTENVCHWEGQRKENSQQTEKSAEKNNNIITISLSLTLSFRYFCVACCNDKVIRAGFSLICLGYLGFFKYLLLHAVFIFSYLWFYFHLMMLI